MRKLNCHQVEKLIIQDLDGILDSGRVIDLEAHLRDCNGCRQFKEEMGSILSAVAADLPEEPGEHYWTNYRVSLEARLAEKESQPHWSFMFKAAGALVAAGLVCLIIWLGGSELGHQPVTDRTVRLEVIEDLNGIYGPTDPETGLSATVSGHMVKALSQEATGYEERYLSWFEIEDESNHLLL